MFDEQIGWAVDADVDFILIETLSWLGEGLIGLEAAKSSGKDVVVNVVTHASGLLREDISPADACRRLEDAGAAVVGMNCCRGPATMLPQLLEVRRAVSCPVAGVPVGYRTGEAHPTMQSLQDNSPHCCLPEGARAFPVGLDPFQCTRYEMAQFARQCTDNDINFIGTCCGCGPHHVRAMAEALGRSPEAGKYSADMSKHYALGDHPSLKQENRGFTQNL